MRVHSEKRDVTASGNRQTARATIKATPKIFDMFANDTYANKPLAIMRELVANGVDAHTAAGKHTEPVVVTLPTEIEPICRVRDYGIGMAHDFVMGPFMAYTDGSTKDQDDSAIGGFGIGSKSPFAYVDQFTLRVVHDGILSLYTMFKDEDGIPAIGLQDQVTTDEPNGVEVSFPVETDDIDTFKEAAQDALQYFTPMPKVINGTLEAPEYSYRGKSWALRKQAGELGVIMGGVRYPVTKDNLPVDLRNSDRVGNLLAYGIDLFLPIGACSVAMSREQLSYNDRTSEGITTALNGILDDVIDTFANLFDTCDTLWEAKVKLWNETTDGTNRYFSSYNPRQALLRNNAKYRGDPLSVDFKIPQGLGIDKMWTIEAKRNRRGSNCPNPKWEAGSSFPLQRLTPAQTELFIVDDLPAGPKGRAVSRLRHHVNENCDQKQRIHVIRFTGDTKKALRKFRTLMCDLPEHMILKTSDIPLPPKQVRVSSGVQRPKVRMWTFNGKGPQWGGGRFTNLTPGWQKKHAITEITPADQPHKGTMVVMESFELPAKFWRYIDADLFRFDELHFVNVGDWNKIKSNKGWVKFEEEAKRRLDVQLRLNPQMAYYKALMDDDNISEALGYWRDLRAYMSISEFTKAQLARPFGRVATLFEEHLANVTPEQRKLVRFIEAKMPAGVRTAQIKSGFEKKQDHLRYLLGELRMSSNTARDIIRNHL